MTKEIFLELGLGLIFFPVVIPNFQHRHQEFITQQVGWEID